MSRYIDADRLVESFDRQTVIVKALINDEIMDKICAILTVGIHQEIANAPTADVVEVVRCKDCKYSLEDKMFGGLWCQHPMAKPCERNADWFCADGERREE